MCRNQGLGLLSLTNVCFAMMPTRASLLETVFQAASRCSRANFRRGSIASGATVRAAIVNPAKLSYERRQDLCLQCHLEPASGDIPAKVVRFDRGVFSYKPG